MQGMHAYVHAIEEHRILSCEKGAVDHTELRGGHGGQGNRADLENVFAAHAVEGTVWCSDKDASYPGFAEKHGLDLVQFKGGGKRTQRVFHIQHVNAYHLNVRRMADHHFRGVATKYLNNYLLWYNFSDYGGGTTDMLMDRLAHYRTRQRKRDIWSRPALPLLRAASGTARDVGKPCQFAPPMADFASPRLGLQLFPNF